MALVLRLGPGETIYITHQDETLILKLAHSGNHKLAFMGSKQFNITREAKMPLYTCLDCDHFGGKDFLAPRDSNHLYLCPKCGSSHIDIEHKEYDDNRVDEKPYEYGDD